MYRLRLRCFVLHILESVKNFVKSHQYEILNTTLKILWPYCALSELCVVLALPTDCRALLTSLKPISTPKKKKSVPFLLTLKTLFNRM